MTLQKYEYLAALHNDSATLAGAARLGLTAPVPSCPGWSVADLVVHTGGVHRAQTNIVSSRAQEPLGIQKEMFASVPGLLSWLEGSALMEGESDLAAIPPGIVEWFEEGAAILANALEAADPEEPVWSWSDDHRVAHYLRMMPIETAVHRWDAQVAHGVAEAIERRLAVDGIDHTFEVMMPFRRKVRNAPLGHGESFAFVQTDGPGRWIVHFDGEPAVSRDDGQADVTVTGSGSDLFLFLWRPLLEGHLEVSGDRSLLARFFELVPPV